MVGDEKISPTVNGAPAATSPQQLEAAGRVTSFIRGRGGSPELPLMRATAPPQGQ